MSTSQQRLTGSLDDHRPSCGLHESNSHGDSDSDGTQGSSNHDSGHFTLRALAAGLFVGILNCVCNTYFILQSGWGNDMSMASALIGFAIFKAASPMLCSSFRREETVLIQTIADTVGLLSISCGFAGVIPALEFLLEPREGAPIDLGTGRLMMWCLGICLVGSTFAPALRQQLILREQLKFPTGTATALLISVLHGKSSLQDEGSPDNTISETAESQGLISASQGGVDGSDGSESRIIDPNVPKPTETDDIDLEELDDNLSRSYAWYPAVAFLISASYVVLAALFPGLRQIPIFGTHVASHWLWALDLSPAYMGQGAIMGPTASLNILLGAIIGWGVLSPLAVHLGWVTGPMDDLEHGPKGWLIWIALAVLLAGSILDLGWLLFRQTATLLTSLRHSTSTLWKSLSEWKQNDHRYIRIQPPDETSSSQTRIAVDESNAWTGRLLSTRSTLIMFTLAIFLAVMSIHLTFGNYLSLWSIFLALLLSPLASVMAARSLGETDFSPNSGIAKISQLIFALVTPASNPDAIIINLLTGSVMESGANQASDLMQDFKTAHLLNASPVAQYQGHIIGSVVGAIISPIIYRIFTSLSTVPSNLFQIPSAYLWLFTARLLRGDGLPSMAPEVGLSFAVVFLLFTALKKALISSSSERGAQLANFVPSGVAVAVGMYVSPSFSFPRAIGGVGSWWYLKRNPTKRFLVVIVASGLVLGEGLVSIFALLLKPL
ncbi:OPT oligopeptide transporter protein-domain-containing protein [Lophiotrema nucula]|uniref:OPT oligopeptide transporter protein-domain-containing protein n=1 Tax=Lophiotrema nucula TaxID=690887 RepID=A0A6A5YNZ9_9PLEO|nr:OPT oligopeptide transporter protein-domain-containing protein [Lophiotrema nucula]